MPVTTGVGNDISGDGTQAGTDLHLHRAEGRRPRDHGIAAGDQRQLRSRHLRQRLGGTGIGSITVAASGNIEANATVNPVRAR